MRGVLGQNLALALLSVVLFWLISIPTGAIDVGDGAGWDGSEYAAMLDQGVGGGGANTALRPMVVLLNLPAYLVLGRNPVAAFQVMNVFYVAWLTFVLCALLDHYGSTPWSKAWFVTNLSACIATSKFPAFYPVLVDAGAYAIITTAAYCAVRGWRGAAAIACVAAVLSREFGIAVVLFGLARDLRLRSPILVSLSTYLPAVVVFFGWRTIVAAHWPEGGVDAGRLLVGLSLWQDRAFVAFFAYFALTVFGGVSLLVWSRARSAFAFLRSESEWLAFGLIVTGLAAAGNADIWRYLAFLLPLCAVLYACVAGGVGREPDAGVAGLMLLMTVLTQWPFGAVDLSTYFRDWFPYYVVVRNVPVEPIPILWPVWYLRFVAVLVSLIVLIVLGRRVKIGAQVSSGPSRWWRSAAWLK
ncbi:MAG: hypothetical protein ABL971_01215 [Vicinamibacterales bacterium]